MQTATNPQTGERVALVGSEWKPISQSATNAQGVKAYLIGSEWITDDKPGTPAGEIPKDTTTKAPAAAPEGLNLPGAVKAVLSPIAGFGRGLRNITDTVAVPALEAMGSTTARGTAAADKAAFERDFGGAGASVGELAGEVFGTAPIGGALAAPIKGAASMAPSLAKYLTPLATALESGGFATSATTKAGRAASRLAGGAATGAAAAAATGGDAETGAVLGAVIPTVAAPVVKAGVEKVRKLRDVKGSNYLEALEGKGRDVVNALRDYKATPGSALSVGEIAAPATGGARLAAMQANAKTVPEMVSEYASMSAQTNEARLAQGARVENQVAKPLVDKINRGLTTVSPREAGRALTEIANAERNAVKTGVIRPKYNAAFEAAGEARADMTPVVEKAEQILGTKLSAAAPETAPATVKALAAMAPKTEAVVAEPIGKAGFRTAKPPTPPVIPPTATLQQIDDLRKAINTDIASAKMSPGPASDMILRNLNNLHREIDDVVGSSPEIPDAAKRLYAEAVNAYRTEYVPRFKTGVNANLFKTTSANEVKMNPDDVIAKFFNPQGEREAEQFVALFGKNPDAVRIARAGIEDLYRREVTDAAGNVVPEKITAFTKKYARPIAALDKAGMDLSSRFGVIQKDALRLQQIQEIAKSTGNKLRDPLPPGANALAVEQRINDLTKGMTPQQLTEVNRVRDDLIREAEYERLVRAGRPAGPDAQTLATRAGKESGLPIPNFISATVTVFNNTVKRLMGHMDDKLALEIARELTNPALAAKSFEKALTRDAQRKATNALAGRAAPTVGRAGVLAAQPDNALVDQ